ncbi:MAG: BREX-1 system adenine-specific DNA-methyltransferase PglX [Methylovulum sp.]|nr:BREX-1 system adenine-specific DNA-methyltransferase PglX [Methylovulum sp.]
MNKAKLKTYAPEARKDFIAAVTARANRIGLAEKNGKLEIATAEKNGDFVIIAGQSWPSKISRQRDNLIARINKDGFSQTMEAVAYTWFNRFAALRYLEIHDYLSHGYRALSSRDGGLPELLNAAAELAQNGDLPDLNAEQAIALKLAGDKDGELYRLALIAQCNALAKAMPFLFERIDNESELLLPDNLLLTDSVIAKLVAAIPEQDWQEVEIIGWLYQFYISEKKDQVIGKVVKSEDIPAATQLFTPNWIVKYLVQNSVGRLWTMANPESTLKNQWEYYIKPAEQTPEVQAQLDALILSRMTEDGGSLNPESITVLDPACGSGHILVEAYDLLKAIYLERGYPLRSIPRLILEKNLYGLDIDDRAAQLAGFALLMKARADDRRLFDNPLKLNVLALQETKGLDADEIVQSLSNVLAKPVEVLNIRKLIDTFDHAKTLGSLIQIPFDLNAKLPALDTLLQLAVQSGDLLVQAAALNLLPFVRQALILGMPFDAVVANPPYMGSKGMNAALKLMAQDKFPNSKSDLFSIFIERIFELSKQGGLCGIMSPFVWMFLKSYEELRKKILDDYSLLSLVQPEYHSFFESAYVPICAFIVQVVPTNFRGTFFDLTSFYGSEEQPKKLKEAIRTVDVDYKHTLEQNDFQDVPGSAIAYFVSERALKIFKRSISLRAIGSPRQGLATADNNQFLRLWSEVELSRVKFDAVSRQKAAETTARWFPYNKGGAFRKWYGNQEWVVNWENDGHSIRFFGTESGGRPKSVCRNPDYYFSCCISWSKVTVGGFSVRYFPPGFVFDVAGCSIFEVSEGALPWLACVLNSALTKPLLSDLAQTLNFEVGQVGSFPIIHSWEKLKLDAKEIFQSCVEIAKLDWDSYEMSWDFQVLPWIVPTIQSSNVAKSWDCWRSVCNARIREMKTLEQKNNHLFIEAYGLQDELSAEVSEDKITLYRADREKDCQRLISYTIGCMMGRYSLDEPGLIYAQSGNIGFDPERYPSFPADADGIVPITDELWFEDDAANRLNEFLLAVWGADTQEENLAWLAASLGQKPTETAQETIRRYLAGSFYKNHLQTYKKRPIYWLFSSGKQGAFQALVYLHRYQESTLARMRAEYVVPLTGKIGARIDMLEKDAAAAVANATRSKLNKDIEKLKKKHVELLAYDEKLRHYADLRITLDLDDGVKVNYGKFGDLLAEVKAVTGSAND